VLIRRASIGLDSRISKYSNIAFTVSIAGLTHVGDRCRITIGETILDRLRICDRTIIGAGSPVTKDISEAVVVFGVPAKSVRKNDEDNIKGSARA
jgi:acetyltransferase-like isoleucine patch superfamily enzyme